MFDHISIGVRDIPRARRFYDAALTPLGIARGFEDEGSLGYGPGHLRFWVTRTDSPVPADPASGLHLCFTAPDTEAVDAFHREGLANGGADNGQPGLRPNYGPRYYAAFLIDPDGFRLEAYCETPE